jgi:hypothetical protein
MMKEALAEHFIQHFYTAYQSEKIPYVLHARSIWARTFQWRVGNGTGSKAIELRQPQGVHQPARCGEKSSVDSGHLNF